MKRPLIIFAKYEVLFSSYGSKYETSKCRICGCFGTSKNLGLS